MMNIRKNRFLTIFMIMFVFLFSFSTLTPTNVVYADGVCDNEPYKCFDDGKKKNYHIDSIPDYEAEDDEEKTWKEKIKEALTFKTVKDKLNPMNFIAPALNTVVNLFFKLNMFGTEALLLVTDVAFDNSIVDNMIDQIQYKVKSMAGTENIGQSGAKNGLFGNMAYPIAVIAVVYGLFLLVFRQSILSSFSVMLYTVVTIALAIMLFANYSWFMKTANSLTTEMSEIILSVGTNDSNTNIIDGIGPRFEHTSNESSTTDTTMTMKKNLWVLMVERPYYYMMFGNTNLDEVEDGKNRFKAIASTKQGSEDRVEMLAKEADEYNNQMVLDSNATTKLGFVPIYQIINGIMSIPFVLLMLMMIVYQFWFLIMAILAPFALLIASIPGQIGVLKRYSLELFYPLLAKVGLSFMLLFVFMFSDLVYGLNTGIFGNKITNLLMVNPLNYYFMIGIFNIIIFGILFILRKRIKDIFLAGSQALKDFRDKQGNPFKEPVQKAVKTTATVGGAVVGAVATGGAGAVIGANIGSTLGKTVAGEGSVEDVSRTALSSALMYDKAKGEVMDRFNKNSAKNTNVSKLNKDELQSAYNSDSTEEKQEISKAGKDFERYEKLENAPQSQLTKDDREFMKEYKEKHEKELEENMDDKYYNVDKNDPETKGKGMSPTQKYQVLRDNGVIEKEIISKTRVKTKEVIDIEKIGGEELSSGNTTHIPTSGTVSAKEVGMSKISTMKVDDMSMKDLETFSNNLGSTEFGQRLSDEQRSQFKETIESGNLEDFKGKQVQDIYGGNPQQPEAKGTIGFNINH